MNKINYDYLKECQKQHMQCLREGGTDAYFHREQLHGYVTGQPLNAESNCFIVARHFLLSVWFNPLDDTVYAEARYSEKYPIYISGIYSMRNMKMEGCLIHYPLLSTFGPEPLTADSFNNWVCYFSRSTSLLLSRTKD